jgi:hypothetical protein
MSWRVPGCGGKSICSPHASGMCGEQRRSPERSPGAVRRPPTNTPAPPSNFLSCLPQKSQLIEAQQSQRRSQCRREKHINQVETETRVRVYQAYLPAVRRRLSLSIRLSSRSPPLIQRRRVHAPGLTFPLCFTPAKPQHEPPHINARTYTSRRSSKSDRRS